MTRKVFVFFALACFTGCTTRRSDADNAAQRFVEKTFTRCGNSYFGLTGKWET